jgi:hypothetical protein
MAQPLSALAHGNVFRPEDGQDRLCGVLGIHGAGKKTASPFFEVDCRNGQLRAAEAEESLSNWQLAISQTLFTAKFAKDAKKKTRLRRRFPLMGADQEDLAANQRE